MITGHHNIACRLVVKAIEADSLGGCFVQKDIGWVTQWRALGTSKLTGPRGSTNRTILAWLFSRRFQIKQNLTASRPDALLFAKVPATI